MKKGFTLVELLAVIVILAVILAIAIPGISKAINNATRASFESNAKMLLQQVLYEKAENDSFDPTSITISNLSSYNLSADNYTDLEVSIVNNEPFLYIKGKNKWTGFTACGTRKNMTIVESTATTDCQIFNFAYNGDYQTYTATLSGNYMLEAWGASGGADGVVTAAGNGGYSSGQISLTNGQIVYVYVGGQGIHSTNAGAGWNGGGNAGPSGGSGGGGGATDVRIGGTDITNRIIVAGGGGGAGNAGLNYYGYGGGLTGGNGYNSTTNGATQSSGGTSTNGDGALFQGANHTGDGGGGGGGYYGGGAGIGDTNGGGGSAYIGGVTSGQTIAGNASMPSISGSTETGHYGNGYVRITYLGF